MRLIDANIFIYAAGGEHPYKRPCLRILELVREGMIRANTDIEVLQEILHFYWRRHRVDLGAEVIDHALVLCPDPVTITVPIVLAATDTLRRHPQVQARDALHAAVVVEQGLEGIVSADRAFDAVSGVTRFDPMNI